MAFLSIQLIKVVGYQRKYANENGDLDLQCFGSLEVGAVAEGLMLLFVVLFVVLCIVLCIVAGSKNKKHLGAFLSRKYGPQLSIRPEKQSFEGRIYGL